jgi:glycosidase
MRTTRTIVTTAMLLAACAVTAGAQEARRADRRAQAVAQWQHEWADGAVFYEVFVRSFADSDGDGVGDLRGLIERLDYLNDGDPATDDDLGVTGLWLMPIFPSPSYHGYDVTDYEDIEPDYGTLADFDELMRETQRRGIRVILDLVLNHSSSQHRWFVDASTGPSSPYRDWYVWRGTNPGWTQPWGGSYPTWHLNENDGTYYYGVFWGGMPDLNFTTPAVRAEARRLAALWLDRGADGFRLDATRYLIETGGGAGQEDTPPTHDFWQEFTASVRQHAPDALVVAENWAPTPVIAAYFGSTDIVERGHELPLNFNFPMSDAILDALRTGSRAPVERALRSMDALYPEGVRDAPFLTNHDQVRIASQLAGNPGGLRSAAAVLLTLPGVPFLYYGEEVRRTRRRLHLG